MRDANKTLVRATAVFWVLFIYIIAALLWWFFSLMHQSQVLHDLELKELRLAAFDPSTEAYKKAVQQIEKSRRSDVFKYVGEGSIFLLLIIIGAAYISRAVRRQLQLQQQQQNFVMAVTHELKTPLSVARLNLETLKKHQLDESKKEKLINNSLQETLRLDMLINNILISSQLDENGYDPQFETLDLSQAVAAELRGFAARYPARALHQQIAKGITVRGDALLLKLLISNLLENANKYAPKQSPITIQLHQHSLTELLVIDEGPGIPDAEKTKVFRKFYRIGNEATRTTKGTGLGLYICKKIAALHRAAISVHDNQPQGSIFKVQFPRNNV